MLFCPCLVNCTPIEKLKPWAGGLTGVGARLACIEKKEGGRLPGTWALTLTRPKRGGGCLLGSGCLPGIIRYIYM